MPKTFCLLNHELTQKQIAELNERFGSQEIFYPKEELSKLWTQILPEESNDQIIKEVVFWLENNASPKDIFVIQGEFGSTFTLVDFALKKGLIPLYATTRRIAKETRNGETVHREYVFEHVCFKKYDYFKEL